MRLLGMTFMLCFWLGCATTSTPKFGTRVQGAAGVVTSAHRLATEAGLEVLQEGGSAVDAAIAVGFALAVTWPEAGNIGGGGFMVVRDRDGSAQVIDYRETAPAAAHPRLFLDENGKVDPVKVRLGFVVAGIPGTVAGFGKAHTLRGRLDWKRLLKPAIRLAKEGFIVDERVTRPIARLEHEMKAFKGSARSFYPDGKPLQPGVLWKQADLARTLQRIADNGARAFYTGELAREMVEEIRASGGIWHVDDLAGYQARIRQPIRANFGSYTLIGAPPPSSGGIALSQMLGILETVGIRKTTAHGTDYYHLLVEAMRRAFLQRALHLGDADHVEVDVPALLSPERIKTLASTVDPSKASSSEQLAPTGLLRAPAKIDGSTTHFGVVDSEGNAVSNTYTIEESWGSKAVLDGFGYLLNNELHDFNVQPGVTTRTGRIGTKANEIAPGKRPLSSQSPSIVERDGRLVGVIGSPGGRTIINTVLQMFMNMAVLGMDLLDAVKAPRLHHQWMPDTVFVEPALNPKVIEGLRARGHDVRVRRRTQGHANSIWWDPSAEVWVGVADPRRGGAAGAN